MCSHTLPHKEKPRMGSILHLPSHHDRTCIEEFIKQPIKYYSEKSSQQLLHISLRNIVYYFQYFLYGFDTFARDVLLRILDYKQLDAFQSKIWMNLPLSLDHPLVLFLLSYQVDPAWCTKEHSVVKYIIFINSSNIHIPVSINLTLTVYTELNNILDKYRA